MGIPPRDRFCGDVIGGCGRGAAESLRSRCGGRATPPEGRGKRGYAHGMPVVVRLLGPLDVVGGSGPVVIRGVKERSLVVLLALHAGRVVSAAELIAALWDGGPPASAEASLRVLVARVRKAVAGAGAQGVLRTRPPGYLLEVDEVDAHRFERLAARGRAELAAGRAAAAAEVLAEALALWRGECLAEVGTERLRAESARWEEARLGAVEARIEAGL